MRVLITGGLGYIGGRLAAFLKQNKTYDIFLTTRRSLNTFPDWAKDFSIVVMNIDNKNSVSECLVKTRPDIVIHLAAMNQQQCEKKPEAAHTINVKGTESLLDISSQIGVKKFIYFSTYQVYGPVEGDMTETLSLNPSNVYGKTKKEAEDVIRSYDGKSGFQTLILRLANGYGYPMDVHVDVWHLVFNAFCKQCVTNQKIQIRLNQYRNFITLTDVVRVVGFFLEEKNSRYFKGIYNVGGVSCLTILEVAKKIVDVYRFKIDMVDIPIEWPQEELEIRESSWKYSIEKLEKTGFQWDDDMDEEILKTLEILL